MTWIGWLSLLFGAFGIYVGCRQGFRAMQWEHRHSVVSNELDKERKKNARLENEMYQSASKRHDYESHTG